MKKILLTAFTLLCLFGIAGWFLFGSEFGSVVDTAVSRTRDQVGMTLSEEFRLDQATSSLKKSEEEIDRQEHRVAELRVGCEDLQEEIQTLAAHSTQEQRKFVTLDDAWSRTGNGTRPVAFRSQMVEADDLSYELEQSALRIKTANQRLSVRQKLLETRQSALGQSEGYLNEIRKRRDRVALKIETSRVDLESVRLLQEAIGSDINASFLAEAEAIANKVSRTLRVQREVAHISSDGRIPTGGFPTEPLPAATVEEVRLMLRGNTAANLPTPLALLPPR